MMHLEDIFALLDAGLNGLASVVGMKPTGEILRHIVIPVMEQDSMTHCLTGLIASQGHIDGIDERVIDRCLAPSGERGIATDPLPATFWCNGSCEPVG